MSGRVISRRHVEAEDSYSGSRVEVSQSHGAVEPLQVLVESLGDSDLADRRPDRAQTEPARPQQVAKLGVLFVAQVQDIGPVNGTEFNVLDAVCGQDFDLLDRVLRDLIGKGAQANHRELVQKAGLNESVFFERSRS